MTSGLLPLASGWVPDFWAKCVQTILVVLLVLPGGSPTSRWLRLGLVSAFTAANLASCESPLTNDATSRCVFMQSSTMMCPKARQK